MKTINAYIQEAHENHVQNHEKKCIKATNNPIALKTDKKPQKQPEENRHIL